MAINKLAPSRRPEGKSPKHWKSTYRVPYYTERFGMMLKPSLDAIIEDNTKVAIFDVKKLGLSINACYCRIYQGWLWLIDNADPEGKYKLLKASCVIPRGQTTLRIEFSKTLKFKPLEAQITGGLETMQWREKLLDYIENTPDGVETLELTGLPLSPSDYQWLEDFLDSVDEFIACISLTETSFKVCKNKQLALHIKARKMEQGE